MSFGGLARAASALQTSQQALNTTAHNITNVNTSGYVRQQVLITESNYATVGRSGNSLMQVGTGTDVDQIRQVRDRFLDSAYREEYSRLGFYSAQSSAVSEVENILGETEGEAFSEILDDLWESINELAKNPEGLETRGSFVENATLFVEKANLIADQLNEYQTNLNTEIMNKVDRINEIGDSISDLNAIIVREEAGGGNANDYRDQRNELLDELSYYVDVSYREDTQGNLLVSVENVPFVTVNEVYEMDVCQSEEYSELVDPYWPHLSEAGPPIEYHKVYNLDYEVSGQNDNNKGELKGLIINRGSRQANYTDMEESNYSEIEDSVIMKAQAQFDNLINGIVTTINDLLAPVDETTGELAADAPYGLDGSQGVELFSRLYVDRFDETDGTYNDGDPSNAYTLYSAGNLKINEEIAIDYNKLCLSTESGIDGDTSVVESILSAWQEEFSVIDPETSGELNFTDYYTAFVSDLGSAGNAVGNQVENQTTMVTQIDNQRDQLMGVSTDEELSNMIKYQHAYNAAARVITVVGDMIDRLINNTGVVGR